MKPLEAYHKSNIGTVANPLLLALLGYFGGKKLGRGTVKLLAKGKSPQAQRAIYNAYRNLGEDRLGYIAGGALGGLEALRQGTLHNENLSKGLNKFIRGLDTTTIKGQPFGFELNVPEKVAEDQTLGEINYDYEIVPVKDMIGTVNNDKFLDTYEKLKTGTILYKSDEKKKGIVSGRDIAQTAVRSGVGFVPAYALGKTMARFAGFPKETLNRIGSLGGIAGALYNTGLFNK